MADAPISDAQLRARARAIAVQQREQSARIVTERTRRALTADGRLRAGSSDALSGAIRRDGGGTGHDRGAEPPLGNPDTDGFALVSTADGERSWAFRSDFDPATTILPAGDCHPGGTLVALLDDLFCRLRTLETATGGYGFAPYGESPYGE